MIDDKRWLIRNGFKLVNQLGMGDDENNQFFVRDGSTIHYKDGLYDLYKHNINDKINVDGNYYYREISFKSLKSYLSVIFYDLSRDKIIDDLL